MTLSRFTCPYGTRLLLGLRGPASELAAIVRGPSGTGDGLAPLQRVSVPEGPLTIARRFQRRVDAHTRHRVPEGRLKPHRESFPTHVAGRIRRCEIPATGCSPICRLIAYGLVIVVEGSGVPPGHRCCLGCVVPPVELAGYCHRSLRDRRWLSDAAPGLGPGEPALSARAKRGVEWGPLTIARRFQRRVDAHTRHRVPEGRLKPHRESFPTHVAGRIRRCEIPATGCSPIYRLIAYGLVIIVKVQVSLRDTVAPLAHASRQ